MNKRYKEEISSGYIDIISAPRYYYPDENRKLARDELFNDKPERIKWRIKQNYDICFLMAYAKDKGDYYLHV